MAGVLAACRRRLRVALLGLTLAAAAACSALESGRPAVDLRDPNSIPPRTLDDEPPPAPPAPLPKPPVRAVSLKLTQEEPPPPPRKVEPVPPITLHLDDVEIRKALELLSREAKLNILVSPGVIGRVTANLKDL